MQFKAGDRIVFIDEPRNATVKTVNGNIILLVDEDGFEEEVNASRIILRGKLEIDDNSIIDKDRGGDSVKISRPKKDRGLWEVDLHYNGKPNRNQTNFDILQAQLEKAANTIKKARKAHIRRVIFIHGLGEGKLRGSLHEMLNAMEQLEYFDASFERYGGGATEVVIYG